MTCSRARARSWAARLSGALALAALLPVLARCTTHQDGTAVEIGVMHLPGADTQAAANPAGAERSFTTDRGYAITLQKAYVVLSRVELLPCEQARLWQELRGLLGPSIAYAHVASTPTVLGVPHVIDLMDKDNSVVSLARMEPPAGQYCKTRIWIDQADRDAVDLPLDVPMVGRAVYLEGNYLSPNGGTQQHHFRYYTSQQSYQEVGFVDTRDKPATLELSSNHLMGELRMELGYYAVLDGMEMVEADYEPNAFQAVRNLLANARAVLPGSGSPAITNQSSASAVRQ